MKKLLVFLCAIALIFSITATANALIYYGDRSDWESAVTCFVETSDYPGAEYSTLAAGTGFGVGFGESLSFDVDLGVRAIGSSWATWSGGYTGEVLFTGYDTLSLTGTFTPGALLGFGFEAEPNPFSWVDITLALADGSSFTQSVYGGSGASFFGWTGSDVTTMTISSETDFAIGRMVAAGVPEPATMLLLGSGLIGLGFLGRKKLFK